MRDFCRPIRAPQFGGRRSRGGARRARPWLPSVAPAALVERCIRTERTRTERTRTERTRTERIPRLRNLILVS